MTRLAERLRRRGKTLGFVPTMGALHQGHLALVDSARKENPVCVVSVFVNPLQFGPREDFGRYPRPFGKDRRLALKGGVDILFAPSVKEMYPFWSGERGIPYDGATVDPPATLTSGLCGARRPGHFRGVATVVSKLFHIVQPHRAYFGQKDAQQCAVVRNMAESLSLPVQIRVCPIVREHDGLAMSSRNAYLNAADRKAAVVLWSSLQWVGKLIRAGERDAAALRSRMRSYLRSEPRVSLEYVETVHPDTLLPVTRLKGPVMVALAAWFGKTRLIDNRIFRVS